MIQGADAISFAEDVDTDPEAPLETTPEISPRDAAPDSAAALLGINCRGSGRCSLTCGRNIFQLKEYIDQIGKS